jgi:membrane protease YdiL (CAAX protease family)
MSVGAVLAGFVVIWLVLDRSATVLGSNRGEWGVVVALLTVATAIAVEGVLARRRPARAVIALGLGRPRRGALLLAVAISVAMLGFFPTYALVTSVPVRLRPDWMALLPGLFAQGGVAEEVLFRGFLFRHLREGRGFWAAARAAAIPFVAVHLTLFATLGAAVALASLLVALSLTFPLAWLFERAGNSVWPPAILHVTIQGAIKLIDVDAAALPPLAIGWMILSAATPWIVIPLLSGAAGRRAGGR